MRPRNLCYMLACSVLILNVGCSDAIAPTAIRNLGLTPIPAGAFRSHAEALARIAAWLGNRNRAPIAPSMLVVPNISAHDDEYPTCDGDVGHIEDPGTRVDNDGYLSDVDTFMTFCGYEGKHEVHYQGGDSQWGVYMVNATTSVTSRGVSNCGLLPCAWHQLALWIPVQRMGCGMTMTADARHSAWLRSILTGGKYGEVSATSTAEPATSPPCPPPPKEDDTTKVQICDGQPCYPEFRPEPDPNDGAWSQGPNDSSTSTGNGTEEYCHIVDWYENGVYRWTEVIACWEEAV